MKTSGNNDVTLEPKVALVKKDVPPIEVAFKLTGALKKGMFKFTLKEADIPNGPTETVSNESDGGIL